MLTTHSSHPDNVKDFYETAHRYTHTLAVEGGSKKNNYRVSYTRSKGNSVVHGIMKVLRIYSPPVDEYDYKV